MNTDLTNRNHTRQSHIIVNARYALSRAEIDIVLTLLTAIKKEDEDFKDYKFTLSELENKTNRKWNSKQLKETVRKLMSKPLELPKSGKGWKIVNWFSNFEYDEDGLISCRFDKALKPYLIELSGTRILADFRHLLPMNSSYSKRMYLLLKEYDKIGMRTFNVEELQGILKVPKSYISKYSDFKKKVLKRAEIDISKFTDLEVTFSEKKRGRKVVEITYTIKKNYTDLKAFIANIREIYPNVLLYNSKKGRPLKCSDKGLLYYSDTMENINKKEGMKLWEYLHENKARLTCFQGNLFDEEEVMRRLNFG
jgi:plasmid replication initiation protein